MHLAIFFFFFLHKHIKLYDNERGRCDYFSTTARRPNKTIVQFRNCGGPKGEGNSSAERVSPRVHLKRTL